MKRLSFQRMLGIKRQNYEFQLFSAHKPFKMSCSRWWQLFRKIWRDISLPLSLSLCLSLPGIVENLEFRKKKVQTCNMEPNHMINDSFSLEEFGVNFACQNQIQKHNNNFLCPQTCNSEANHKLNGPFCDHSKGRVFFGNHRPGFLSHFQILFSFFVDFFCLIPEILSILGLLYIYNTCTPTKPIHFDDVRQSF